MNPLANIPPVKVPGLTLQICEVTPVIANAWLKLNIKNRKIKDMTVESFARDMRNNAWHLTHQGIAFDDRGNLIDGQHRLQAIARSKKTVRMFVSVGWPTGGKVKTMDAVDRGVNRSLADQLDLQHGIKHAGHVVQIANGVACACLNQSRVRKSSVHCVLAVVNLYVDQIKYVIEDPIKVRGLKIATVSAVVVLGRTIWPDRTSDFYTRLKTGENLTRGNAILTLRNWLMADGFNEDVVVQRNAIAHHLHAFVDGRSLSTMVSNSDASLLAMLKQQPDPVDQIRKIYHVEAQSVTENKNRTGDSRGSRENPKPESNENLTAFDPGAIKILETLGAAFSGTDLSVRLDGPQNRAGLWLMHWKQRGWIESIGVNQWRKVGK